MAFSVHLSIIQGGGFMDMFGMMGGMMENMVSISTDKYLITLFTFSHLADALIKSDLQ